MSDDRHFRAAPRSRTEVQVTARRADDTDSRPIVGYTRDVGSGGLFMVTDADLQPGDRLDVALSTPTTWQPLRLAAEVRRRCGADEGGPGVGLVFVEMTGDQALALRRFVAALDYEG